MSVRKGNQWRRYCFHNRRIYTQMRREESEKYPEE